MKVSVRWNEQNSKNNKILGGKEHVEKNEESSRTRRGQALTEYGLIIGLIAVVTITVLTTMGGQINTLLGKISTALIPK